MKLAVDIGNSKVKISVFNKNKIIKTFVLESEKQFNDLWIKENFQKRVSEIIVCSVRKSVSKNILVFKNKVKKFIVFSHSTPIPIKNCYSSPQTLGLDRLAAAVGAHHIFPGENCLIIDAGTAITFDLLNDKNEFLGGSISPGLETRYKSLAHFTQKLPLIKFKNYIKYPGGNTENSIHLGVQLGIIHETMGYINFLKEYYSDLHVLVTGGDSIFFVRNIKKNHLCRTKTISHWLIQNIRT